MVRENSDLCQGYFVEGAIMWRIVEVTTGYEGRQGKNAGGAEEAEAAEARASKL